MEILKEISREAIHCLSNTSKPITHLRDNCENREAFAKLHSCQAALPRV